MTISDANPGIMPPNSEEEKETSGSDAWENLDMLLETIRQPAFPDLDFTITDFGAIGNGTTDCTLAIRQAIAACHDKGGGRVVIPAGNYVTGAIHLKSNVNLHVVKGATLSFSTNPDDYLPLVHTRWEGVELMGLSPLIYAYNQKNIAVTGEGTLDGRANSMNWWPWRGQDKYGWKEGTPNQTDPDKRASLFQMAENNVSVVNRRFGKESYLRPQFIQPYQCENVLIEGVTILHSPMWILNPVLCRNVTIRKVTVESQGPNSDGCNPESCRNVLIKECRFNTGDDCIAIKSGRNADGRRLNVPSENIIIQDCYMANGHGGVVIGSEVSGGVRNVFAENCQMSSPLLNQAIRIKTNSARGGVIENIYLRNIKVGQVARQILLATMFYEDAGAFMPTIRNIQVSNMEVKNGGETGVLLDGYPEAPIQNLHLINVSIDQVKEPYRFSNTRNITFDNVKINGHPIILKTNQK